MTMNELASGMIAEAKNDLESAEIMFSSKKYAKTIWNCKQFMEKMLKAVLYLEGHGTIIDHEIAGMLSEHGPKFNPLLRMWSMAVMPQQ